MVKTAQIAVPISEENTPKNDLVPIKTDPSQDEAGVDIQSLRGTFAKSICKSHGIGTLLEREACGFGVPCNKLSQCIEHADTTIRYLDRRKSDPKAE